MVLVLALDICTVSEITFVSAARATKHRSSQLSKHRVELARIETRTGLPSLSVATGPHPEGSSKEICCVELLVQLRQTVAAVQHCTYSFEDVGELGWPHEEARAFDDLGTGREPPCRPPHQT